MDSAWGGGSGGDCLLKEIGKLPGSWELVGRKVALEDAWFMLGVLVLQTGEGVNDVRKGACANHVSTMANFLKVRAEPVLLPYKQPCRIKHPRFLGARHLESGAWPLRALGLVQRLLPSGSAGAQEAEMWPT
jgi:hypothetical protein